ncbi:MAG: ABC transporter substrate-binding protein [Betaproteobacteria bacterium]|nr:ABC transporter substrate-binding protein [Betaproteobacteria bacterium]
MNHPKTTRRDLLRMMSGAGLAAIWPATLARAAAGPLISMGYQTNLVGLVGMVAEEEKLYDKVGANVRIHRFGSGQAVRDAMIAKHVDVGAVGSTPFIVGVAKGELAGVGVVAYTGRMVMVVVRKDTGIKSVAELRGRKIASQLGSQTDHAFQNKIAPKFGLKKGDFTVVNVKFENHVSALSAGSVDAFAGVDPFTAIAEHEGLGVALVDFSAFDLLPSMLAVNHPVLEQRYDAVVAFLKGWLEGVRIIRDEPQRAVAIAWKIYREQGYKVPEEVIKRAVGRIDVNPDFVPELKPYLAEQSRVLLQQGRITSMPDWDRALLREPLQKAMRV